MVDGIVPFQESEEGMEWYHWLLVAVGVLWIACAVVNYVLLKKMGCDIVIQGEGGHFWLFFAPFWVVPFMLQYRDTREERDWQRRFEEVARRHEDRQKRECEDV